MKTLIKDEDYYVSERGQVIFTEVYHKKRGYCCGCGCKHCPYDYEGVEQSRRSKLIAKRTMMNYSNDK
jgi:Family of unknown function (DUF5522)